MQVTCRPAGLADEGECEGAMAEGIMRLPNDRVPGPTSENIPTKVVYKARGSPGQQLMLNASAVTHHTSPPALEALLQSCISA